MDNLFMDIDTGKVSVTAEHVVLRVLAIGSCIVVVLYDRFRKIGGMAHVMLPGRSLKEDDENKTKYAENAIDILLAGAMEAGASMADAEISIFGGADMLGEGSISEDITASVVGYLKELNIELKDRVTGGNQRRSVSLDVGSGMMFYTEGDSAKMEL
jgi:chemotaxis protein CheD